jgi:hypothetical protein
MMAVSGDKTEFMALLASDDESFYAFHINQSLSNSAITNMAAYTAKLFSLCPTN